MPSRPSPFDPVLPSIVAAGAFAAAAVVVGADLVPIVGRWLVVHLVTLRVLRRGPARAADGCPRPARSLVRPRAGPPRPRDGAGLGRPHPLATLVSLPVLAWADVLVVGVGWWAWLERVGVGCALLVLVPIALTTVAHVVGLRHRRSAPRPHADLTASRRIGVRRKHGASNWAHVRRRREERSTSTSK